MKKEINIVKSIYDFNKENLFFDKNKKNKIIYGFLYNNFKDMLFKNTFIRDGIISEDKENIICALVDTENFKNSIFFTKTAFYIENSLNGKNSIKIFYDEIEEIKLNNSLNLFLKNNISHSISPLWEIKNIAKFLNYICDIKSQNLSNRENNLDFETNIEIKKDENVSAQTIYGNVSNAGTNYGLDKFSTPRGHGFAAERVNHIYDKLSGKKAVIVGDDNAANGADRLVNGVNIQTKYCSSGSKCIQECFQDGKFRYVNPDGSPMQIEVPSDKYEDAVRAMENRIKRGEIPKITKPEEARKIVRKGNFTYEQAKNIAKAGTVESITFDSVNGAVISVSAFGISSCLSFATAVWNGDDFNTAIKKATYSGIKVGGTAFITAVLSSQLSRAGLNSLLVGSSEAVVGVLGSKASALLVNAFRSGTNIYGAAAMKSAAKLLRGNVITAGISVAVLSVVDITNIFRGRISGAQLLKNITNTATTVAGGTAGWVGGATAGAALGSVVPIVGTVAGGFIGGLVGSFAGGTAAGKVSNKILDNFIEDDVNKMIKIIEKEFSNLATDYLLTKEEAEKITDDLKEDLTASTLKDMFADDDKEEFARDLLLPHIEYRVKNRLKIKLPTEEQMVRELKIVLEEIADNQENK
ncbi:MAG: hypothetical protein KGV57_05065 [Fusobacterium sp.]|nr:hypothetical protein [Fusobacterium sp.]